MNLQRIQIKIASNAPADLALEPFIEIFGRWRKEKEHPAEWVDLADYAHMVRGPGIVLIGQRCNFSFDMADGGPGILYAAKKGLSGSAEERIASAFEWCLEMTERLAGEKEFPFGVALQTDTMEIRLNDRLETANTAATDEEVRPAVIQVLDRLFGPKGYNLTLHSDPAQCYGFSIAAKKAEPLDVLRKRLLADVRS
jgi:hypothetical protein